MKTGAVSILLILDHFSATDEAHDADEGLGAAAGRGAGRFDGQQRLTSLYVEITGAEVIRSDYTRERIRIAFDPLSERFEVANAATAQDHAFISDIAEVWKLGGERIQGSGRLPCGTRSVAQPQFRKTGRIQSSIGKLVILINGHGAKLNKSDFILTLMSVFWEEDRKDLEQIARSAAGAPDGKPSSQKLLH